MRIEHGGHDVNPSRESTSREAKPCRQLQNVGRRDGEDGDTVQISPEGWDLQAGRAQEGAASSGKVAGNLTASALALIRERLSDGFYDTREAAGALAEGLLFAHGH